MEECGELIQECSKSIRKEHYYNNKELTEEIGDVLCMIELLNRLTAILLSIEDDVSSEVIIELEDIINSIENSKCSNDMFCGMDKKF